MKVKILAAALAAATALGAWAVPAKRGPMLVVQPDGTTLTVLRHGDERLHYLTTTDNKLLVQDANGQYSYASFTADGLPVSTGVKALDPAVRQSSVQYLLHDVSEYNMAALQQKRMAASTRVNRSIPARVNAAGPLKAVPQSGMGRFTTNFPAKGKIKALVLLVEYKDIKFNTNYTTSTKDYFTDFLKKDGFNQFGGTGCVEEYFRQQSMGQFTPDFDLVGPITLPSNRSYYGGNDVYGNDKNPEEMVIQACQLIDDQINFKDYDNDGDGYVDNVFVFYAGQGEASYGPAESIWPHSWELSSAGRSLTLDGVKIDRYGCTNEWEKSRPDGIGTFVHEFSHVMGIPDLYHTSSAYATNTPGAWSVMDYGPYNNDGCTPPNYSVYERNAMGWIDLRPITQATHITLNNIAESNDACIINTEKSTEFFLFENRQKTGWDKYVPGHGMLIWHIDYVTSVFDNNVVNNTSSHQYVDIEEAGGVANSGSASTMAAYSWPGTKNMTEFTATTTPALKSWSGKAIELPITGIKEVNGVIDFDVDGGVPVTPPSEPSVMAMDPDFFLATWKPAEGAKDYRLTVTGIEEGAGETTVTADMGTGSTAKFPDGWTASANTAYTSGGNFGAASPSLKMATNGAYLQSDVYASELVKVSFWMKGMSSSGSTLSVKARASASDVWATVKDFTPANGVVATPEVVLPAGMHQIRFEYTKSQGNVGLDDVVLTVGGAKEAVLPDYNDASTNGITTVRVDKLMSGISKYRFSVKAVHAGENDAEYVSKPVTSAQIQLPTNSVDNIAADGTTLSLRVDGRVMHVATPAARVDVYSADGRLVQSQRTVGGTATIALPGAGLYIVRAGQDTAKALSR